MYAIRSYYEFIAVISLAALADQPCQRMKRILVNVRHIGTGNRIRNRIKIRQVAQNKPAGVPDAAVGVGKLLQDIVGNADRITSYNVCYTKLLRRLCSRCLPR